MISFRGLPTRAQAAGGGQRLSFNVSADCRALSWAPPAPGAVSAAHLRHSLLAAAGQPGGEPARPPPPAPDASHGKS